MRILMPNLPVALGGVGTSLPEGKAWTNSDLLAAHPSTATLSEQKRTELAAFVEHKYGVHSRHLIWSPAKAPTQQGLTSEQLALLAARQAIGQGEVPEMIVLGSTTSCRYTGSQAAAVYGQLGGFGPAVECKAGCSTSLSALELAWAALALGRRDVLVCCAETLSKVINRDVRETWFGLADGAAAAIVRRCSPDVADFTVDRMVSGSDGRHVNAYTVQQALPPLPDRDACHDAFALSGDGELIAQQAFALYGQMLDTLYPGGEQLSQVAWCIPHQVNRALIDKVFDGRGFRGKLLWSADRVGNLGGASVLYTLAEAVADGRFQPHEKILLMSVGGGLSFAMQEWTWRGKPSC